MKANYSLLNQCFFQPPKIRTNKTVAVIGSGPAGLAAAAQLNKVYFNKLYLLTLLWVQSHTGPVNHFFVGWSSGYSLREERQMWWIAYVWNTFDEN